MKIGIDGGALDQSLKAGIYNVTVQLSREWARIRAAEEFIIFTERPVDAADEELFSECENVKFERKKILRDVTWDNFYRSLPSAKHNGLKLELDGFRCLAPSEQTDIEATFEIDSPFRSAILKSHTVRPADVGLSDDGRDLGIPLVSLFFRGPFGEERIEYNDSVLGGKGEGFHEVEFGFRWTTGRSELPVHRFSKLGYPLLVTVITKKSTLPYVEMSKEMMEVGRNLIKGTEKIINNFESNLLRAKLKDVGVFHSHHFSPRIVAGAVNIVTAYDIIPVLFPEMFGQDAVEHFNDFLKVMRDCDLVFCISEATRRDLIDRLDFDPKKVISAPIDCDPQFRVLPEKLVREELRKYNLEYQNYILSVGTLEPRKNHVALLRAYDRFRAENSHIRPKLVIVGRRGWDYETIFEHIAKSPFSGEIIVYSDINGRDLVNLYNGAYISAYLSVYEGFGLPPLESLACGVPVLAGNRSSLPEVVGSAGILVNPESDGAIFRGLSDFYAEAGAKRSALAASALIQRSLFSWRKCAEIYAFHIDRLISAKKVIEE